MQIPPFLKANDTVALVCTARKFSATDANPAVALLESWGLKVQLGKTIGLDACQLGGTDAERTADFQEQLDNEEIKAIWCARGGYGTVRIIDDLDFTKFKKKPKWIIGFSDITVLHSHLNVQRVATIHAIMPYSVPNATELAKISLRKAFFGEKISYQIPTSLYNKTGKATGELVGGNISILYSLLGSESAICTKDKILFIEDLDEYLYHLDRMLQNFKRNSYFEKVKGIIVGSLTDMHDNEIPFGQNEMQIIAAITEHLDIPICFQFPAGHQKDNRALVLGRKVSLEVGEEQVFLEFQ